MTHAVLNRGRAEQAAHNLHRFAAQLDRGEHRIPALAVRCTLEDATETFIVPTPIHDVLCSQLAVVAEHLVLIDGAETKVNTCSCGFALAVES